MTPITLFAIALIAGFLLIAIAMLVIAARFIDHAMHKIKNQSTVNNDALTPSFIALDKALTTLDDELAAILSQQQTTKKQLAANTTAINLLTQYDDDTISQMKQRTLATEKAKNNVADKKAQAELYQQRLDDLTPRLSAFIVELHHLAANVNDKPAELASDPHAAGHRRRLVAIKENLLSLDNYIATIADKTHALQQQEAELSQVLSTAINDVDPAILVPAPMDMPPELIANDARVSQENQDRISL